MQETKLGGSRSSDPDRAEAEGSVGIRLIQNLLFLHSSLSKRRRRNRKRTPARDSESWSLNTNGLEKCLSCSEHPLSWSEKWAFVVQ